MHSPSKVLALALGLSFLMLGGCSWLPWTGSTHRAAILPRGEKTARSRGLALTLHLDPLPLKLSDTRRIEATLQLKNVSSRFRLLEFANSQRFDILVRNAAGRVIAQWSDDRVFEAVPGSVGINPGEHLEYNAALSTRDLQPSKPYTVTAFFPSRPDLKVELPLVPEN